MGPAIGIDLGTHYMHFMFRFVRRQCTDMLEGTTYSCVGIYRDDRIESECLSRPQFSDTDSSPMIRATARHLHLSLSQASPAVPSYEFVADTFQTRTACLETLRRIKWPCVFDAKRLIGRKFADAEVQADMKHFPFKVVEKAGKPVVEVEFKGEVKQFTPEEISSMILTKMRETAESYLGGT
ncbi:MAG: hypothetical protein Q9226_009136, partial [Calogaya cf. arnoldii]